MEKIMYYENLLEIDTINLTATRCNNLFNELRVAWSDAKIPGQFITVPEVENIIRNHGRFDAIPLATVTKMVAERFIDNDKRFKDFKIKREELIKLVEIPNCERIARAISQINSEANIRGMHWHMYSITPDEAKADEAELEKLRDAHRSYITNEEERARFDAASKLVEALNEITAIRLDTISPEVWEVPERVCFFKDGKWQVEPAFVSTGCVTHYPDARQQAAPKAEAEQPNWSKILMD